MLSKYQDIGDRNGYETTASNSWTSINEWRILLLHSLGCKCRILHIFMFPIPRVPPILRMASVI